VDCDGANGLVKLTPGEALRRGIYVPPGAATVPYAAYHPDDWGDRADWRPAGRLPMGADATENGGRIVRSIDGRQLGIRCFGFLADADGAPHVQGETDPYPGAYLSLTALVDPNYFPTDARRYVDAAAIPGWVLPGHSLASFGVGLGDFAVVEYGGRQIFALAYDVGSYTAPTAELSVHACDLLGIPSNPRTGGAAAGITITILPQSHTTYAPLEHPHPLDPDEISFYGRQAAIAAGLRNP
jgi:hypothetical protein